MKLKVTKALLVGALATGLTACSDSTGTERPGMIRVAVYDNTGSGVGGAAVRLIQGTTTVEEATSSFGGSAQFQQVSPGTWLVSLTPPSGYRVPTAQANPQEITLSGGQVRDISFVIEKTPDPEKPGGGGEPGPTI